MYKKWFIRFSVVLLVFFAFVSLFIFLQKDTLINKSIESINQKLDAEVSVDGKIDITFFKTFPSITLEINKVFIADKYSKNDTLANVEKINFTINPFSLFGDELSIKSIMLQNGIVRLKTFKDGKSNYEILKKKEGENKGAKLNLEEIIIENIHLVYNNLKSKVYINTNLQDAVFSGKFYNKDFEIFVKLNAKANLLKISKTSFLNKNDLVADFNLQYQSENKCFTFQENDINIDGNSFELIGDLCTQSNTINLNAKAKGTKLENALNLIPKDLFTLKGITGKGTYNIEVSLTGKLNKPTINLDFELEDAKANIEAINIDITDLYTTGSFSNTPRNNLVIKDFALKSGETHLKGNLIIPNLKEKRLELKVEGEIYASLLKKLNLKNLKLNTGKLNLKDILLNFNYREKDSIWIASKLLGNLKIENLRGSFENIKEDFSFESNFIFAQRKINVKKLKFNIGKNDIQYSGTIENVLNYFQNNIFGTNDALKVNGKLYSKLFDINLFLKDSKKNKKVSIESDILKWLNIVSNVQVKVDKLVYNKLIVSDIKAFINSAEPGLFSFKNFNAKSLNGTASGKVELRFFSNKVLEIFLDTKLKHIDIQKLFKSLDDFDQKAISYKNIEGDLDADLILSMSFKNYKEFQKQDLLMHTNFVITDGELIKLQSLKSLSKYLSIEQLEHIYFTKYKSTVSIAKGIINLRNSKILSNLIALELGGTHSFDNKINYAMKLNLKNLLATKFKKKRTLNADYVNNIMGGINIFISMKGTVAKPIIKMDKQSAFKAQQKELEQQKQDIKDLFKKDKTFFEEEKELYFDEEDDNFINFEDE